MRNIKLTIEYDGGRYDGWQRLGKDESSNTIEQKLLEVIRKMTNEVVTLNCGSRTELGVHAYEQTANFLTKSDMRPLEMKHYFNRYLPRDIAVTYVEEVPERFHASLNAKSVTYLYRIAIGDTIPVFDRKYVYYCFGKLNLDKMKEASNLLLGTHDFKGFSSVKKSKKSTMRTVESIDIYSDGNEVQITMKANDFLHNMARIIAGVLIEVGEEVQEPGVVLDIFNSGVRNEEIEMADAKGLFLQEVEYDDAVFGRR